MSGSFGTIRDLLEQKPILQIYRAEFSYADRRAASSRHGGSESPSVDGGDKQTHGKSATGGTASRGTPNVPSHGTEAGGAADAECVTDDTSTPAGQLLPEAAGHVTGTPVAKVAVTASSPVDKGETAPPSAPVKPALNSQNVGDPPMILTFGDFNEAAQVLASDEDPTELALPGAAAAAEAGESDDEGEADNAALPLSPSTVDSGDDLRRLWGGEPVVDLSTTAVESATSSPTASPTTTVEDDVIDGNRREDCSSPPSRSEEEKLPNSPGVSGRVGPDITGNAGPTRPETPDLGMTFFSVLWADTDSSDSAVATTATTSLPVSTTHQRALPINAPSCPSADNEVRTPALRSDAVIAPVTALSSGKEEAQTPSNAVVDGMSTLSATAMPFIPSDSTTEASSVMVSPSTMATSCTRGGGHINAVGEGASAAAATTLPAGQGGEETEARAQRAGETKSTLSATPKPFAPSSYTPEAASAAKDTWLNDTAVIFAKAKAKAATDARAELEATVGATPEERRETRHNAAALTAAAETLTRPQGANQWSEVDALSEAIALWQLSDMSATGHAEERTAAKKYLANSLTAGKKLRQSDCIDHALHRGMQALTLGGEASNEEAMRCRKAVHSSTQERLEKTLQMGKINSLPAGCVSTTTKVDNAFSGWLGQLTLEEAATPQEEEARYLQKVTVRTSVQEAFASLAMEKEALLEEERDKSAAAGRDQKMLALERQQREAIWDSHARAQAACQARAKRAEEEAEAAAARIEKARAAAVLEQQRVVLEERQRQETAIQACLADAKRHRSLRIRRAALARVIEDREDKRALYFPCSNQLRYMWRDGKVPSRGYE